LKILALIGSPRKGSNTDILVEQFLQGSKAQGHTGKKLYLYNYEISPCIDCRKCKQNDCVCVLDDGMQGIYPKIDVADLIVFATPLYWYGPSAKMKLLIDRIRPYVANKKLKGKKAVVVAPAGDGPKACGPLIEMFRMSFDYLGVEFVGKILGTAFERKEILTRKKELKKAYDLGASL
jgi:multimeric flavodoxin WrbA